jgi:hypothetical protein
VAGGASLGAAGSVSPGVVAATSFGVALGSTAGAGSTGSAAGACATGAGGAGSAESASETVVVVAVVATALGGSTLSSRSGWGGVAGAEAPAVSPSRDGKPLPNEPAGPGDAAGGARLPAASCSGAEPVASLLNGSWLTRKAANMAKPQLNATTEATTAAINRRTLGNIRPRITAARSSAKHASLRCRSPRGQMAGATLTESVEMQCKKSKEKSGWRSNASRTTQIGSANA